MPRVGLFHYILYRWCSWCGRYIGTKDAKSYKLAGMKDHGLCPECAKKVTSEPEAKP